MEEQATQNDQQGTHNSPKLDEAKKRALEALVPLIDEIKDIDPEQKFDICLNAMRFTDNRDLAPLALEAALSIEAKGPKAEALVSLINEINYLQQA